ncbi:MAG: pyrroline-5-carboxylate reductase, partial [Burkholderiaceae bacterium]
GGGNMASAIAQGLLRAGWPPSFLWVVEPDAAARARWAEWGVIALAEADASLSQAQVALWAVKPQVMPEATARAGRHVPQALHISVAAGVTTASLQQWLHSDQVVRAMPNTPALIGQGISGVYACPAVSQSQREWVQHILQPTGEMVWIESEDLLDAVTAVSGSGPAYAFYLIEAMAEAGTRLGLPGQVAQRLATATVAGAGALALASEESAPTLRARVTSKGGTTHAAITSMEADGVGQALRKAVAAAHARAQELGRAG